MTGSTYGSSVFFRFVPEVGFPVGSYKSSGFGVVSKGSIAASAAPLVHPLTEIINNRVDDSAREGVVPPDGTRTKIPARLAGAPTAIGAERPLFPGVPVQGRRMDDETRVLPAEDWGSRFGVYRRPMTAQTTPAVAVGR